jgi:starch phosphorylase
MGTYLPNDVTSIQSSIVNHVEFSLARTRFDFQKFHCYAAVSHSLRDRLIESFNDTQNYCHEQDVKRIYYISIEFLIGRCM